MVRSIRGIKLFIDWLVSRASQPKRLIAGALIFYATSVSAFEEQGHIMVAQLMTFYLNDNAQAYLTELVGEDWKRQLVTLAPGIEQEITRATNRPYQPLQQTLFSIDDTEFDAEKHCPNNACSVGAVLESRQVLLDSRFSDAQKREALFYLMHYMVQLHIPANCGFERDLGGQKVYLKDSDLKAVNLAWIWNYDLYRKIDVRWFTLAQRYYRDMNKMDLAPWVETLKPQDWAFETHLIAREKVYGLALEGRYSAKLMREGKAVIETQLMKAGYRTAMLLNDMFG